MQIDVDPHREKDYLKIWRKWTIVDGLNNLVFMPEFSPKKGGNLFS